VSGQDHAYLGAVTPDQLAALVFELASQLHVERTRRMALESLLVANGTVDAAALANLATDAAFADATRAALDANLRRLLRIVTADGDRRGPLRPEALS
jgi:hypothetical protein